MQIQQKITNKIFFKEGESWIGPDKIQCFAICLAAAFIQPWFALGISAANEYKDSKSGWNVWRIIWYAIGAVCGTVLSTII